MRHRVFLIVGILLHILIFTQSLLPADLSAGQSGFIVDALHPIILSMGIQLDIVTFSFFIRKLAHFTEYFLLAMFWYLIYLKYFNELKLIVIVLMHGLLTAIIDETIQLFVDRRSGAVMDVLIDFSGVLVAVLLMHFVIYHRKRITYENL
jgi:VanZ family protein